MDTTNQQKTVNPESIRKAVSVLSSYARGSGRGQLLPLDQLASESLTHPALRTALEEEMIGALGNSLSECAVEYVCSKLGLIGTAECVPVLARLLDQPDATESALAALRAIPGKAASNALRQRLQQSALPGQVAIIHAVGFRRDPESVPALIQLLEGRDAEVRAPAAVALGEIGNLEAARALRKAAAKTESSWWRDGADPTCLKAPLSDALLTCGERLKDKHPAEAKAVYLLLANAPQVHIKRAAENGLRLLRA